MSPLYTALRNEKVLICLAFVSFAVVAWFSNYRSNYTPQKVLSHVLEVMDHIRGTLKLLDFINASLMH